MVKTIGNGSITLMVSKWLTNKEVQIFGGPFRLRPNGEFFGICLLEHLPTEFNYNAVSLPIADYSIPTNDAEVRSILVDAIFRLLTGQKVYVGCMGGFGRTGIILSLLAKAIGLEPGQHPVKFVRLNYVRSAVETASQYEYVERFGTSDILGEALKKYYLWKLVRPHTWFQ